jgi:hypothetical protein
MRLVTINGVTDGDCDAASQESGNVVGLGVRSHNASALPDGPGPPDAAGVVAGAEPPLLQAATIRVSAAVAATREGRITPKA